jgi:hypothetical protein
LPTLVEFEFPLWQAVLITIATMVVYTVFSFFVHPEPNTDNLDNVNRFLWRLHCCLGPGRFTADTTLDLCVLVGILKSAEAASQPAAVSQGVGIAMGGEVGAFDATRPIAPLDPNRFAQSSANFVAGQIQLDTQRFRNSSPLGASSQPAKV